MKTDIAHRQPIPQLPTSLVLAVRRETDNLRRALAEADSVKDVEVVLSQTDRFLKHARRRLRDDTETINLIQRGRFLVIEKLGRLLERQRGGRGKKNFHSDCEGFHPNTLTAYRKVHDHSALIDAYFDSLSGDDGDVPKEASLAGFLRHIHGDKRNQRQAARNSEIQRQRNLVAEHAAAELLKSDVKYACFLVDPSWYVGEDDTEWLDVIGGMPVSEHAADNAVVFVRSGGHEIAANRADSLIGRWDFRPINDGLFLRGAISERGRFFKKSVERVVIGARGRPAWPVHIPDDDPHCPPGKVHALIESLTPFADNLRLELFSQRPRKGWVTWADGKEPVAA